MRSILRLILMFRRALVLALLASLAPSAPAVAGQKKVHVVASFYPLAWAAREVGGDAVRVTDLTPPGSEPHDLELSPDDRDAIEDADLVIVLGGGFQPAVEEAAEQRDGKTLSVIDEYFTGAARRRARKDPHVWLDLRVMLGITGLVGEALEDLKPGTGSSPISDVLVDFQLEAEAGLAECERDLIVTAHESFGWLARAYGLRQEGIAGIDPESEPSPKRLAELADLVKKEDVTTIFTEDLVSPKVARTLAREAGGVRTAVLSPLESLTKEQRRRGDDYLDVMRKNLSQLRSALSCS